MTENKGRIYVSLESFVVEYEGAPTVVTKDRTRVREGHPLMAGREHLFKEVDAHYDVEDATADPGRKRGAVYH